MGNRAKCCRISPNLVKFYLTLAYHAKLSESASALAISCRSVSNFGEFRRILPNQFLPNLSSIPKNPAIYFCKSVARLYLISIISRRNLISVEERSFALSPSPGESCQSCRIAPTRPISLPDFPNIARNFPMFPNFAHPCRVLPNITGGCPILWNLVEFRKSDQIFSSVDKSCEISPNNSKFCHILSNPVESGDVSSNLVNPFQILPDPGPYRQTLSGLRTSCQIWPNRAEISPALYRSC